MLLLISSLKLVCEIALLSLLGQGLVGLLSGARRDRNVVYQLLSMVTRPVVALARAFSPRVVLDRHVPLVAFLMLVLLWFLFTAAKIAHCMELGVGACR